jgi:hypothetical protein
MTFVTGVHDIVHWLMRLSNSTVIMRSGVRQVCRVLFNHERVVAVPLIVYARSNVN